MGWRVQNQTLKDSGENRTIFTTRGSVNLREIGDLRGVSLSCGYVLRGSEFYLCICSGYRIKSSRLDLASSYLESHEVVTGYNPTT